MSKKVYFISGPAGVGKSTTSLALAEALQKSSYISGDTISHLPVSGHEKPWESEAAKKLTWENINALTTNLLHANFEVIIDWIISIEDIKKYVSELITSGVEVRFVILWTNHNVNLERDMARDVTEQMGDRVNVLRDEFLSIKNQHKYFLDSTNLSVNEVVESILQNDAFCLSSLTKG